MVHLRHDEQCSSTRVYLERVLRDDPLMNQLAKITKMSPSRRRNCRCALAVALLPGFLFPVPLIAGPNLMAIGNYGDVPFKQAEGRDSFTGREVVYSFSDPDFDFGRVVVRSKEPASIVRRDLFVGFSGDGLVVDGSGVGGRSSVSVDEVQLWLRVHGQIQSGKRYEWEMETPNEIEDRGMTGYIPAVWADGQMVGARVTIKQPEIVDDDRIQRMIIPHGIVTMNEFETQTGSAWVVIPVQLRNNGMTISRFSLREIDTDRKAGLNSTMPTPVRYIPIRSVLEDQIAAILERGARALKAQRSRDNFWNGGSPEANVAVTARVIAALAELNPSDSELTASLDWLGAQWPQEGQRWGIETVARQLYALSRHGDLSKHRAAVQRQIEFLLNGQVDKGGWGAVSAAPDGSDPRRSAQATRVDPTHEASFLVLLALREAAFAGAIVDRRAWRGVMEYWSDAVSYDGGFTRRAGGLDQATTSADTAMGAAAIVTAVDVSAQLGGRRCGGYRGSALQLKHVGSAIDWLHENYGEFLSNVGSLIQNPDPYLEAGRLQFLGAITGITHLNDKDHFVESAQALVRHFDPSTAMFGVRADGGSGFAQAPSVARTTEALTILGVGAAPPVCQRIVVGDDDKGLAQYSGDAQHLVRYLAKQRGRQFNWRRVSIDDPIGNLVETPIMLVKVVGPFSWTTEQWSTLRSYAMSGGTVVFDVIDGAEAERSTVLAGLKNAFPEYAGAPLSNDHPLFSTPTSIQNKPRVQAFGNGFRDFVFLPEESWSCHYETYDVKDHEASFQFMNNLLTYCRDDEPPASAFAGSSYPVSAVAAKKMTLLRLETGGDKPAYPDLVDTLGRLMQSSFRTGVDAATSADKADAVWLSVTGEAAPTDAVQKALLDAVRSGKFVLADVVSGNEDWDETFRGRLKAMDSDIGLELLPRDDTVFTGEIAGTQGFDAVNVALRRALHTRFSQRGRCDLYRIRYKGRLAGVYSAYDLSSGVAYHLYPECRGVMPDDARKLAMNALLTAYGWKLSGGPGT